MIGEERGRIAAMDSRDETGRSMYRAPSYSAMIERDLAEAQTEIRRLTRALKKEQQRLAETAEAYNKTVSNLVRTVHENTVLRYEYERLKQRTPDPEERPAPNILGINITRAEIAAIRKSIARLHHPDVGGDAARMQTWNVILDQLEENL
jgi:regulator of replication initiation timing